MSNILHNATVDTLLERRSIRKFKPKPLPDDVVETLETVAQHAASSQFLNDWSAIRVTEPAAKKRLAEIGGQPYIATAPLLYVFVCWTSIAMPRSPHVRAWKWRPTRSRSMAAIVSRRRRTTRFWHCTRWRRPRTRSAWVA